MRTIWISAVCLYLTAPLFAQSSANYHLVKKTVIGGEGGWDYLLADAGVVDYTSRMERR